MSSKPGEFALIEWLREQPQNFPVSILRHIGEDCAIFAPPSKAKIAVTTDLLLEEVHFCRRWISPYFLGRKSLAVNLSDLAAVGARPYSCMLGFAFPVDCSQDYFRTFMKGFLTESKRSDAPLIGGDLSRSEKICISVTLLGTHTGANPAFRAGGQVGDSVVLIGDVGLSRMGLQILRSEDPPDLWRIDNEQELADWAGDPFRFRCLKAHLLPEALTRVGVWLCENKMVNAMIDVSDGLAADALHIAQESELGLELDIGNLPFPEKTIDDLDPVDTMLNGGEDYSLLFTASQEQLRRLSSRYPAEFPSYRVVGHLTGSEEPGLTLKMNGRSKRHAVKGFDHFK